MWLIIGVFNFNLNHAHSYPHELWYSFSLRHIFDDIAPHVFYMGFTENYMDYSTTSNMNKNTFTKKQPFTFYKWQWNIIRQDKICDSFGVHHDVK